jgi:type IV pilus assembly protein PilA
MQREHLIARAARTREDGFTLLELMMVVLIISILIAIAVPTFFSATSRAKDRAAQSTLRNATTGAKGVFLANNTFPTAVAAPGALTAEIGNLTFVVGTANPTSQNVVSVLPTSTTQIVLAGQSKSGTCFYVLDDEAAGTTLYAALPGAGGCAANTITPTDPAWKTTW